MTTYGAQGRGAAAQWYRPMTGRSREEPHRTATPLELFFDLVFVVAVAQAGAGLHHAIAEDHLVDGLVSYAMVFFAIWWAWMNFTWFASAYDTDDIPYRLAVFVQMSGVLVIAAGVPRAMDDRDFAVATVGYVIMRLAAVAQWLRAARSDPEHRTTCLRYAAGVALCQVGWVLLLALPEGWRVAAFAVMALCEMLVPPIAERANVTGWHPHHIAERYGLFTIIVLGESILAATVAVQGALDDDAALGELATTAAGGLLIVFSMWWLYFAKPAHGLLTSLRMSILWGYGHYLIFGSAAAVGAGLAVFVDHATGKAHIGEQLAAAALTGPVALYVLTVWALHLARHRAGTLHALLFPAAALLVLATTFTGQPVLLTGLVLAATVAAGLVASSAAVTSSRPA